jgi:hypothetical protein
MGTWVRLLWDWWKEMELNSLKWRSTVSILLTLLTVSAVCMYGAFEAFGYPGFTKPQQVQFIVQTEVQPLKEELAETKQTLNQQTQTLSKLAELVDRSFQSDLEIKIHNARKAQCQALNSTPKNQRAADAEERILIEARRDYYFQYGITVDLRPCEEY